MNEIPNKKAHNLSARLNQIAEADNGSVFSFSLFPLYLSLSVPLSLSPLSHSEKQQLHLAPQSKTLTAKE